MHSRCKQPWHAQHMQTALSCTAHPNSSGMHSRCKQQWHAQHSNRVHVRSSRQVSIVAVGWRVYDHNINHLPQADTDDMMACCWKLQDRASRVQEHKWISVYCHSLQQEHRSFTVFRDHVECQHRGQCSKDTQGHRHLCQAAPRDQSSWTQSATSRPVKCCSESKRTPVYAR